MRRPRLLVLSLSCAFLLILLCTAASSGSASASPTGEVSGPISEDTSWTLGGSPYVVTGDVTVNPDVTLEIEPGVQVRFDGNYAFNVRGILLAEGTESQPILFTSNRDTPAPGDWAVVDLRSDSPFSILRHAIVEYGGNAARAGWGCAAGAICANRSELQLDMSIVRHSATRGLVLVQSDATVTSSAFDGHPEEAIRLHGCDTRIGPCRPTIAGNTFTNSRSPIARHSAQDPFLMGNQASDNETNGFVLGSCRFEGENTWHADLPYVIPGWCSIGGYGPVTLSIRPGAVVKMGGGLEVKYSAVLTATGTAEEPIVFTSLLDDSAGGDTNNDGNATLPAANDYDHIAVHGSGTTTLLEHAILRYGGGSALGAGPLVFADWEGSVTARHCDLSQAEVGVMVWRGASLTLEESVAHDLSRAGVRTSGGGDVLISRNRFVSVGTGVWVEGGHPTVRENTFEGNSVGVDVPCNPLYGECAPVVSPGNRFVGAGQHAVINHYPAEGCVGAVGNWWGDETGPKDWSSEQDACGLVDNPGGGAVVSDGVNYSPWQGGVTRPLIIWPSCGVTARDRPTFEGRAQAGASVAFYDGAVEMGQTTCAADHSFNWTPSEPLSDGLHIISAQAMLEGATSLLSPELPLTVDSTLAFDPAGIRISYSMHGVVYTQPMRDASGCASIGGDIRTPLWVREGALMTVTVPMRNPPPMDLVAVQEGARQLAKPAVVPESMPWDSKKVTVTFRNDTNHIINYILVANRDQYNKGTYTRVELKPPLIPGDTLRQAVVHDYGKSYLDVAFETRPDRIVARQDDVYIPDVWDEGDVVAISTSEQGLGTVMVRNNTGRKIVKLHFVWEEGGANKQTPGGSFASWQDPLKNTQYRTYVLPKGRNNNFWVVMEDEDGTIYWREVRLGPVNAPCVPTVNDPCVPTVNLGSGSNTEVELKNEYKDPQGESKAIGEIRVYRHRDGEKPPSGRGLQLFDGMHVAPDIFNLLMPGESLSLRLENSDGKTRYSFVGYDHHGEPVWYKTNINLDGAFKRKWTIRECPYPGRWRIVPRSQPGAEPIDVLLQVAPQAAAEQDGFTSYFAGSPAIEGRMSLLICVHDQDGSTTEQEVDMGNSKKDPDGYVYDAEVGIEALIAGATVNCDVFDEEARSWDRWPGELYDGQFNPQVTTEDGYYAFLVPSGLYRVRAQAEGYTIHTSPDLRVINEAVHYNVPMEKPRLYVPMLLR